MVVVVTTISVAPSVPSMILSRPRGISDTTWKVSPRSTTPGVKRARSSSHHLAALPCSSLVAASTPHVFAKTSYSPNVSPRVEYVSGIISMPLPNAALAPPMEMTNTILRKGGSQTKRILCYGDSLTAGFCDNGRRFTPYGHALREGLTFAGVACEVTICGLSGLTAKEMVADSHSQAIKDVTGQFGRGLMRILDDDRPFDLVIIMSGTNDLGQSAPVQSVLDSTAQLHALCHQRGIATVALAPPLTPHNHCTREARRSIKLCLDSWQRNSAHLCQALIDPEEVIPRDAKPHWEPDGIHFSPSGSHALGQQLAAMIVPLLARGRKDGNVSSKAYSEYQCAIPSSNQAKIMMPIVSRWLGA